MLNLLEKIFSPKQLPPKVIEEVKHNGTYSGILFSYYTAGTKIAQQNNFTGKCVFYEGGGEKCFNRI
jgi:hypothetical protein